MTRTFRIVLRLVAIARILARHDALAILEEISPPPWILWLARRLPRRRVDGRPGQKLARALTELGPGFIKLGQFLSTRADLLGETLAEDLSALQDRLPPFPAEQARAIVEAELGQPLDHLFVSFDDEPISAASIAQVHLASVVGANMERSPRAFGEEPDDGTTAAEDMATDAPWPVAVKVLRPGIEQAFEKDLDLLYWLAGVLERTRPRLRRFRPLESVRLFESIVRVEMDLTMEAAAASELADNFAGDETYHVPSVDWRRTSRRVLTMERVGGIPMDDREALIAAGFDLREVLTRAAAIFFNQVFRDGFFHGDQHPGNMFIDPHGNIVAVDFGIMGRLDQQTREFLADMLLAFLARDYNRLAEVHVEAGYLPREQPPDLFAQALRAVSEPIFDRPLNEISVARLLGRLLSLSEDFDMPVQPQLLLLQKNMVMAEGISRSLDPTLNIWTLAEPLIADWVRANRGPEARLRRAMRDAGEVLDRLPRLLAKVESAAEALSRGGVRLHPESHAAVGDSGLTWHIRALWLALAALAIALVLSF